MALLDRLPWLLVLAAILTLGLAPFVPEPHIWETLPASYVMKPPASSEPLHEARSKRSSPFAGIASPTAPSAPTSERPCLIACTPNC